MCVHLLINAGATAYSSAHFGQGSGQIWLDNVRCYGYENELDSCLASSYGNNNCNHSEDAGVRCGSTLSSEYMYVSCSGQNPPNRGVF